jgi:ribosomal protein S21
MTNVTVYVRNGDVTKGIRQLKKKCEHNGVFSDIKRLAFYTPPGEAKRLRHRRVLSRLRKAAKLFA